MKPVSSWSFDAPLAKVDVPRICDEASAATNGRGERTQGAIKVRVSSRKGSSLYVIADLDLAIRAALGRGVRGPDGFITDLTHLDRFDDGAGGIFGLRDPRSPEMLLYIVSGESGLVVFAVATDLEASELINKLLDKVTVTVEVW